ncbi:MAG: flagellar motor protein MotB [Desulfobacterales bacterium]|nr:flagellar motor protein MotB [Desulfobacterales bacterium]
MVRNNRRGKSGQPPESGGGGWEVVYSGFALIMLCFFIMLASFSTMEKKKMLRFVRSFSDAMRLLPGGVGLQAGKAVMPDPQIVADKGGEMDELYRQLQRLVAQEGLSDQVTIHRPGDGLAMRLSDTAVFAAGVADISPKALPLLDQIGTVLQRTGYAVRIEGHTDDTPIKTARFPSNWELSTARAVTVLRYFIERHRIPTQRLSAAGFSRFQPVAPNDGPLGRAKNRRVEIVLSRPADDPIQTGAGS